MMLEISLFSVFLSVTKCKGIKWEGLKVIADLVVFDQHGSEMDGQASMLMALLM